MALFTNNATNAEITNHPLLEGLPVRLQREAERLLTRIEIDAGRRFITEERRGREFFLVTSGSVSITRNGERIGEVGPGDVVGELALLHRTPRQASAIASTDLRVWVGMRNEFVALLDLDRRVARRINDVAVGRTRSAGSTLGRETPRVRLPALAW